MSNTSWRASRVHLWEDKPRGGLEEKVPVQRQVVGNEAGEVYL